MFINKEGKLFNKVSIIDIIVIIALVVAGFGVYSRYMRPNEKVQTSSQKIEYTMLVRNVRIGTVNALGKLGPVYSDETKEYIGDIQSIEYTPAKKDEKLPSGKFKLVEIPDKYDVYVTLSVDGKVNSEGFYTSTNQAISVGSKHLFNAKYVKTTGEITSIKEIK